MSKFCTNCGTELADEIVFCTDCGTDLSKAQAQPTPQQKQAQQPAPPIVGRGDPDAPRKKFKAPVFIIIGVLVIAGLAAALFFTDGFGLFWSKDDPNAAIAGLWRCEKGENHSCPKQV